MKLIISCLIFILSQSAFTQTVVKSDNDYYSVKGFNYKYIFPSQYEKIIPELDKMNTYLQDIYQKDFNWKLDDETSFVLGSNLNQIANAFATNLPNLNTTFYNGGFEVIDTFATSSWLKTLLLHETAHLYQLNTKSSVSSVVKDVFGNNVISAFPIPISITPLSFFPFPIVTNPNFFLPNWMVEGNAVLNESRFGIGGRLYSGEIRAFVYAMAKADLFNATRLTNVYAEFPYGRNSYLSGGYAWAYIAEKYGTKRANQFYQKHADHYLNPFLIDGDVQSLYGKGYKNLLNEMGENYKSVASNQKQINGHVITSSKEEVLFNRIGNEVVFTTSRDNASFRELNFFNIENQKIKSNSIDLKSGKVFKINDKFTVASSGLVDRNKIKFSLWSDDEVPLVKYLNHFVMDIKNKKVLSFKSDKRFGEGELFLSNKFYDQVNSTALFGENNSVYYFKQEGEYRTLYRNKKALIKFESFYAKLVDINNKEEVFFISSTEFGSSLFKFSKGKIYRISNYDNIVNAKITKDNKFLVSSINENGYDVRLLKTSVARTELPFVYKYKFEKEKTYGAFQQKNLDKLEINHLVKETSDKKKYNSLADIKMSNWTILFTDSDTNGSSTSLNANFSDPLSYNYFSFYYEEDESDGEQDFSFAYMNNKHLLSWGLVGGYEKRTSNEYISRTSKDSEVQDLSIVFKYNWLKYRSWKLKSSLYVSKEFGDDDDVEYYANLSLNKLKSFSNNLLPYRYSNLLLEYEQEDERNNYAFSYDFSHGFENQKYLMFSSTVSYTDGKEIGIGEQLQGGELISFNERNIYSLRDGVFTGRVGASYKMVGTLNWLSWYFPLGLRRIAIGPEATFITAHTSSSSYNFSQIGISVDLEILANHTYPVLANFGIFSQERGSLIDSLTFKLKQEF